MGFRDISNQINNYFFAPSSFIYEGEKNGDLVKSRIREGEMHNWKKAIFSVLTRFMNMKQNTYKLS